MDLTVDHVPFAFADLESIAEEFAQLGLEPEYGGVHGNGVTHMSVLGFDDRSYVELIAEREGKEGEDHDFWPEHIRADAGPAAWCCRVPDVREECRRILERGYAVHGPLSGSREREDGTLVEWEMAEFGSGTDEDVPFPFVIADRTPLSYRVEPAASVAGGPLEGIGQVVLAVEPDRLEDVIRAFRNCYGIPTPVRDSPAGFGTVASVPGQPVAFAAPDGDGWLADHLERFPGSPCSCLLATDDLEAARETYPLGKPLEWPKGRVAFFDSDVLGRRLGVLERRS